MKKTYSITGMGCQHCVNSIEKALNSIEGIKSSKVSLENNNVEVEYDEALVSYELLQATVKNAGYQLD